MESKNNYLILKTQAHGNKRTYIVPNVSEHVLLTNQRSNEGGPRRTVPSLPKDVLIENQRSHGGWPKEGQCQMVKIVVSPKTQRRGPKDAWMLPCLDALMLKFSNFPIF